MAYGNIAHSPQRCSVLVGPDLRADRFMACTVTLLGRLGDPPLPHSLARLRSLNTHEQRASNDLSASSASSWVDPRVRERFEQITRQKKV